MLYKERQQKYLCAHSGSQHPHMQLRDRQCRGPMAIWLLMYLENGCHGVGSGPPSLPLYPMGQSLGVTSLRRWQPAVCSCSVILVRQNEGECS